MTTLMASLMEPDNNVTFGAVTSNQSLKSHEHGNMTPAETLDELNARYATTLIPFTILLGLFGVIGIVGNILVFIVYGWGTEVQRQEVQILRADFGCDRFRDMFNIDTRRDSETHELFQFYRTCLV